MKYLQITGSTFGTSFLTYESMAALAGHGLAVCPNITHPDNCPYDTLQNNYYIIDYTRQSLFAYWTMLGAHTMSSGVPSSISTSGTMRKTIIQIVDTTGGCSGDTPSTIAREYR